MVKKAYGFTIVELLIVIVVIAILAAISIVAYRGIQDRANASSASAKATQAVTKLKVYYAEHESYPTSLSDAGIQDTSSFQYTVDNTSNPKTYCITATTSNKSYYQNTTTATMPTTGGCPGDSVGGVPVLTNLVANPSFESNTTGWSFNWTTGFTRTLIRESSGGYSGNGFYSMIATNSAPSNNTGPYIQIGGLSPTSSYQGIAYVRTSVSMQYRIVAELRNSSGSAIVNTYGTTVTTQPGVWERLTVSVPPTPNLDRLTFCIYNPSRTWSSDERVDYDAAMLVSSTTTPNYADGSSQGWTWNGTPNNSSSTGFAL